MAASSSARDQPVTRSASGERAPQDLTGVRAGVLAGAGDDVAVHDGGVDAGRLRDEAGGTAGEVLDHVGHARSDGVGRELSVKEDAACLSAGGEAENGKSRP